MRAKSKKPEPLIDPTAQAFIDDYRAGKIVAVHTALAAFDRALTAVQRALAATEQIIYEARAVIEPMSFDYDASTSEAYGVAGDEPDYKACIALFNALHVYDSATGAKP